MWFRQIHVGLIQQYITETINADYIMVIFITKYTIL